jgi:transcriptional regulator with XRE-family HTH domain
LELGLTQKQVAEAVGTTQFSIIHWEKDIRQPNRPDLLHRVIAFLGYDPLPHGESIPERLRLKRRELGWRQVDLAAHLGVQDCTVRSWEAGGTILMRAHRVLVAGFLGLPEDDLIRDMGDRFWANHGRRPVGT